MTWALAAVCALATVPAGMRWLRVAQREHYLSPSVTRFAWRWWRNGLLNPAVFGLAVAGLVGTLWADWPGLFVALSSIGPRGLPLRGRTTPLRWTPRLRRLAVTAGLLVGVVYVAGALVATSIVVVAGLLLLPVVVDLALWLLAPVEWVLASRWVERADGRLRTVAPKVVAITGSYGKTTTKGYVTHLLSAGHRVVATPASFNNRLGLARAINESLVPGTEIFVAEMGTYGRGEIADMCRWVTPTVGVIVSLGPVHLERFRTMERIVAAKSEILDGARVGVICVDNPLLAALAEERALGMPIIETSTTERGRVGIAQGAVVVDGSPLGDLPAGVFGANLVVAVGVCLALGVDMGLVARRLAELPTPEHRQTVQLGETGATIIDDTFNSNPDGARRALGLLAGTGSGRKVVVTPGMVELGPMQATANETLGREAAVIADHIVVVAATNRASLLRGVANGRATVTVVGSREEAVAWVRQNLGPGDTVLYENDLPDHYP